jgi:hypothetical protein
MALFDFLRHKPKTLRDAVIENPIYRQQKELYEALCALCEDGYDADELPHGLGEYGLTATNPILTKTVFGSTAYLGRLRTIENTKVNYQRIGSIASHVSPNPIDVYQVTDASDRTLATLYVSPYHKRISTRAPQGFLLAAHSFA